MFFIRKVGLLSALLVTLVLPFSGQSSITQVLQPAATTSPANQQTDPLGRNTPSNSILGFLKSAQAGEYSIAAQYLQMSPAHRQTDGEATASKLKFALDHAFTGHLGQYNQPDGTPQEGVSLGRQRLGTMTAGDVDVDLDLVRVSDPSAGKIWLISSDTLAKLPELSDQVAARQVANKLPAFLVKHQLVGMPLWQWLALLLSAPIAAGLGWLVLAISEVPLRWWARRRGQLDVANWRSVSGPMWLLAGTLIHQWGVVYLRMPLLSRHYYFQVSSIALIVSATWIAWRFARWLLWPVRFRALDRGQAGTGSLMLLGERILKAV